VPYQKSETDSGSCFKSGKTLRVLPLVFCSSLIGIALVLSGCKKEATPGLSPARVHAITRELAAAARAAAPAGSQIRIGLQASEKIPEATDHLDITPFQAGLSAQAAEVAQIQRSLGAVATRNGLTEEPSESRGGIFFFYQKGGTRTHAVYIHLTSKVQEPSGSTSHPGQATKLAIILDDLGSERAAAEAVFRLPYPITISVLPNHEQSPEIAQEALRRGYQVLLHLPMQSVANEKPEAQELRSGMPDSEVSSLVEQFLKNVPGVVGVNNHQGSQATTDFALMEELMPVLRERQLFYVDSRTTAATVAYETAQEFGVRSGFRNVPFLDDVAEVAAVRKQLELAFRGAREKGEAIAIGHPHPATLQALSEVLPRAQAHGVRLVFVSELVH
jgi:polysaccharide deacetylase 2 family uncharacterized protein YibQ